MLSPGGSTSQQRYGMKLQRDDWVKTRDGRVGKIVHISKITVFVAFEVPGDEDRIDGFLESQLTMAERSERQ
jgi:hypothetical protein